MGCLGTYGIQLLRRAPKDRLDWLPDPLEGFACTRCHDVLHFTRINAGAWNHLITHLSGGLLYGHEVVRPSGVVFERKRAFRAVPNRPPSKRGAEVQQMLAEGLSYSQIALRMRVTKSTVASYARRLYQRRGVKGWKEFQQAIDSRMRTVE